MALGEKEKKQLMGLAIFAAVARRGGFTITIHIPKRPRLAKFRVRIAQCRRRGDAGGKSGARGSGEALRQKVEEYQSAVRVMRRLVPAAAEVPNLIDDVSTKAKLRGVGLVAWTPLGTDNGSPFQTAKYKWGVVGHFDQIGEFLTDIGSLPRIMVPYDVSIGFATGVAQKVYSDTTGALLEVNFLLRTFVKPAGAADTAQAGNTA